MAAAAVVTGNHFLRGPQTRRPPMRIKFRYLATAFGTAGVAAALLAAPTASGLPKCTTTAPNTTQCDRPGGSTSIITSPNVNNNYNYPSFWNNGFGYGGIVIGR
jgi:hypothetical protein